MACASREHLSKSLIPVCIFSPSFSLPSVLPSSSTLSTQDELLAVESSSSGCHSSEAPAAAVWLRSPEGCTDSQSLCDCFSRRLHWFTVYLHSADGYICFFQETQDFKPNTHTHTHLQMLQRKLYSVFICIFWLLVSLKLWNVWEMYVLKKSSGAAVVKYRFSEIRVIFRSLSKKRQSCKCPVNTYVELHDTNADVREGFRFLPLQFFRSPTIKANLQINTKQSYENC